MVKKATVSVIVPVYNSEKYLEKCLQSILAQTLESWELIAVDDGSIDQSASMLDFYSSEDSRIRVYHTENRGVACARQLGVDVATGE